MNNDDRRLSFFAIALGAFMMVTGGFSIFYRHEYWYREWDTLQIVPMWAYVVIGVFIFALGVASLRRPPGPGQKQD
jgi:hypothetical protein